MEGRTETFYGDKSDKEIEDFYNRHVTHVRRERQGFWARLFRRRGDGRVAGEGQIIMDVKGISEAIKSPMTKVGGFEPPVLQGKFRVTKDGKMFRIRK